MKSFFNTILFLSILLCLMPIDLAAQNKKNVSRFLDNLYNSSQNLRRNQRSNNSTSELEKLLQDAKKRSDKKKEEKKAKQQTTESNDPDAFYFDSHDKGKDKENKTSEKKDKGDVNAQREKDDISLIVNGEGSNKTEATRNALRSAIEQAYGTFVSASTEILNDELVKDEIATVSSGNIKSYKELSSTVLPNGSTSVTLSAVVSIGKLIKYAQAHGSSAEFAGQTFMMNMRMRELNKKNEQAVLEHIICELEQIRFSLFDFKLEIAEPRVSKAAIYEKLNNDHCLEFGIDPNAAWNHNAHIVVDVVEGYAIPMSLTISSNDNYDSFVRNTINTLNSISLSEEERSEYKTNNYPYSQLSLFGCDFYLRNSDTSKNPSLGEYSWDGTEKASYLTLFREIIGTLLSRGMQYWKIITHTQQKDIIYNWGFYIGTKESDASPSVWYHERIHNSSRKHYVNIDYINKSSGTFAHGSVPYIPGKTFQQFHHIGDDYISLFYSSNNEDFAVYTGSPIFLRKVYSTSVYQKMKFQLFFKKEDIQNVVGFEVQPDSNINEY